MVKREKLIYSPVSMNIEWITITSNDVMQVRFLPPELTYMFFLLLRKR